MRQWWFIWPRPAGGAGYLRGSSGGAFFFAATEIPWDEIAFRTTHEALRDWLALIK